MNTESGIKKEENNQKGMQLTFLRFFSKLFFISLILLLIAIIMDIKKNSIITDYLFIYSIVIDLLKTIAIAIFISSIFDYIIGTKRFVEYIKDKLIGIIVTKDFMGRLNKDDRKEMLKTILRPSREISNIYSGINQYFTDYIDGSLKLFNSHFRSGYTVAGIASFDTEKQKVKLELNLNYRIYKVMGEFERLPIGFEDEDSKLISTTISGQGNIEKTINCDDTMFEREKLNEDLLKKDFTIIKGSEIEIPEIFGELNHLDISRKIIEYGSDHWHLLTLRSSQACDKLTINITCKDNLMVKKAIPFGNPIDFKIENAINQITIYCNNWLKPGSGVAILIAKECEINT